MNVERNHINPGLIWKHMLTVLFVKALQAPQGTCIETLHTCWCIFWWCSWHSSWRTQEEVGRATRPAQKLAPQGVVQGTWMSSKSQEMMLVCGPENKKSYQYRPQTGRRETKQRNLGFCNCRRYCATCHTAKAKTDAHRPMWRPFFLLIKRQPHRWTCLESNWYSFLFHTWDIVSSVLKNHADHAIFTRVSTHPNPKPSITTFNELFQTSSGAVRGLKSPT